MKQRITSIADAICHAYESATHKKANRLFSYYYHSKDKNGKDRGFYTEFKLRISSIKK